MVVTHSDILTYMGRILKVCSKRSPDSAAPNGNEAWLKVAPARESTMAGTGKVRKVTV